jgi:glutamine synthetase
MNMAITQAEYIWLDGAAPVQRLRSKSRIVALSAKDPVIETFPEWSFDGSSTYQASGHDSDLLLRPVRFIKDPLRGEGNYLVLCEVLTLTGRLTLPIPRLTCATFWKQGLRKKNPG